MTKIVAFEGIDGTGKTVQLARLKDRLTARGLTVMTLSFPVYSSFFGTEVGNLLSGKGGVAADTVDSKSMALWFALDRFEAFQNLDYSEADVLLINRYVLSNAVYQSIRDRDLGKPDVLDFIFTLEHEHFHLPRADAYLVLDVYADSAAENVDRKGFREYVGNARDIYEAIPSLQERARRKYIEYAARLDNVYVIPCMEGNTQKSIEAVGTLIDGVLKDIL